MTITAGEDQAREHAPPWVPTDRTFGARLALIRQHMGWGNVAEAALACGLPANSWRNWERDNRAPMKVIEICAIIAERTGVDRWWLMTGEHRAEVNQSSGQSVPRERQPRYVPPGTYGHPKGRSDQATSKGVRARGARPSGHPGFPVLPPTLRRPSPRKRVA